MFKMGEFVGHLAQISPGYEMYLVVIANRYGNTAEEILFEKFPQMAYDIGVKAVISNLIDHDGVVQAEQGFDIGPGDLRPVLIISEVRPDQWAKIDGAIKIQLGGFQNADDVRNFLFKLSKLVSSDEFKAIKWEMRKRRMFEIAAKIPIVVDVIGNVQAVS